MLKLSRNTLLLLLFALTCSWIGNNVQADEHEPPPKGNLVGFGQPIVIRARLVEINRSKLNNLGVDFVSIPSVGSPYFMDEEGIFHFLGVPVGQSPIVSKPFLGFLDALCKNDLAHTLANPKIIVRDGGHASLATGAEVPIKVRPAEGKDPILKFIGTKLDVVTNLLEDNRIRVKLRLACSNLEETNEPDATQVRVRMIDTGCELALGETFAVGGLVGEVKTDEHIEETVLVLLVTPELAGQPH